MASQFLFPSSSHVTNTSQNMSHDGSEAVWDLSGNLCPTKCQSKMGCISNNFGCVLDILGFCYWRRLAKLTLKLVCRWIWEWFTPPYPRFHVMVLLTVRRHIVEYGKCVLYISIQSWSITGSDCRLCLMHWIFFNDDIACMLYNSPLSCSVFDIDTLLSANGWINIWLNVEYFLIVARQYACGIIDVKYFFDMN